MKAYYLGLAKYWAATARNHYSAGYYRLGALYQRYSDEHSANAEKYED